MNITFLYHSSFLVELSGCTLLFDWYGGPVPDYDRSKPLYVFASHHHGDHYAPEIFAQLGMDNVWYVLANCIRLSAKRKAALGIDDSHVFRLAAGRHLSLGGLEIQTYRSTDAGVGMATGKAWFKVPETIKFVINGELAPGVTGKDVILHIIGMIGVDGALYQAMEFTGSAIRTMGMDERMSISNMAIEAGGKAGLIEVDDVTRAYLDGRTERPYTEYHSDPDAQYAKVYEIDAASIVPTVSFPHLPSNTCPVAEARDVRIDQAVIGSCTNGRIADMRQAADVLRGRKIHPDVRCIVIPATQAVYRQCMEEGLMDVFLDANCAVSTPTCGPCLGGYMGILAAGERAIATTNRNFVGRMGDPTSEVYLSSPAVAAASAVLGHIGLPEDLD